jgi:protein-disulfide isomerase
VRAHRNGALIDADVDLLDDVEGQATPHFFINGRRIVGAQPFEKFQTLIDEELKNGQARVARGTPPQRVYAEIMATARTAVPPEKKEVPLPTYAVPSKGSPRAQVVIQEFSDFQCPFCARVQPTLRQLMEAYGDRVRIVFRHRPLPMHSDAALAAEAAMEAFRQKGSNGFWTMHDLLFGNAAAEGGLKETALAEYAARMGLDVAAFRSALTRRTHRAAVEAESKVADDADITGTPTFVINGYLVSGAQPLTKFRKAVQRALRDKKTR